MKRGIVGAANSQEEVANGQALHELKRTGAEGKGRQGVVKLVFLILLRRPKPSRSRSGDHRALPLSVRQRTDRLLYFAPRRDSIQWSARGPLLELVHNARVKNRRLRVNQFMKPHLTHRSRMRALSRSNRPSSSLIHCESNVLFPSTSIPFRCL